MQDVSLRPLTHDDTPRLAAILRQPSVATAWPDFDEEKVRAQLIAEQAGLTVWGVVVDGRLAGAIQLGEHDDPMYAHGSIDLFLDESVHGAGVGPRAIEQVVVIAFQERGLHRLVIDPARHNARAIRAYARVGFRTIGTMRAYERGANGEFHDGLLMERLRDDRAMGVPLADGASLREATPAHFDAVARMSAALYAEDPSPDSVSEDEARSTLQHLLVHPDRGRVVVIARDGVEIGYAVLISFWSNELGGLICIVDEVYLEPASRGRGIGAAFFGALAAGKVSGFEDVVAIDLEVTPGNARAQSFYRRLGFVPHKNANLRRRLRAPR